MMNYMFILIQIIFLQVSGYQTGNPITDFFSGLFRAEESSVGGTIYVAPNWIPVATFVLIMIVVFGIYRYWSLGKKRPNDEEPVFHGALEFIVARSGQFEAYVNHWNKPLQAKFLRGLRKSPKFIKAVDEILKLRNQQKLYTYQGYYIRTRELIVDVMRRRRVPFAIISTAPLDDQRYAFSQSEPIWRWGTLSHDFYKTVICHESSHKVQVEYGNDQMDVWLLAPIPMVSEKISMEKLKEGQRSIFDVKTIISTPQKMEINVLPYSDELAQIVTNIIHASKQVEYIENMEIRFEATQSELRERDEMIQDYKGKASELEKEVARKPLRKMEIPPQLFRKRDEWLWYALTGMVLTLLAYLPNMVPSLAQTEPAMLVIFGLIAMMALKAIFVKPKDDEMEELMKDQAKL